MVFLSYGQRRCLDLIEGLVIGVRRNEFQS